MSPKKSSAARAGVLAIGVVAAGLSAWFFGATDKPSKRNHVQGSEVGEEDPPAPLEPGVGEHELLAQKKKLFQELHPGMEVPDEFEDSLDLTTLPLLERRERYEKAVIAHMRESLDLDWATTKEADLTSEIGELARESDTFELLRSECRSLSCLVHVAWKPDVGQSAYDLLVSTPLGLGCRLHMLPPEPDTTEATVYLDCTRQRELEGSAVPMVATVSGAVPSHPPEMEHSTP